MLDTVLITTQPPRKVSEKAFNYHARQGHGACGGLLIVCQQSLLTSALAHMMSQPNTQQLQCPAPIAGNGPGGKHRSTCELIN
jgi:hypothetical protein